MTTCISMVWRYRNSLAIIITLGNHDPEGGLKIRKIYKKLGISTNPCSHDLANCQINKSNARTRSYPTLSLLLLLNSQNIFSVVVVVLS